MIETQPRDPVLFIDCTSTIRSGLNTGIQRVVKSLAKQAQVFSEYLGIECIPMCYQFNAYYRIQDAELVTSDTQDEYEALTFQYQDIYFCPDAFWTMDIYHNLPFFRDRGVNIAILIHDIIPITHPHFIDKESVHLFEEALLEVIRYSQLLPCVSRETQRNLMTFCKSRGIELSELECPVITMAPALEPLPQFDIDDSNRIPTGNFFLMVGTIEPRRSYLDVLHEFSLYRKNGGQLQLLIIGKQGTKSSEITGIIQNLGNAVTWLIDANDNELTLAYKQATAIICASRAEGYGMPVAEGLAYNGLVLANRLPVFGEFAGAYPYYFDINVEGDLMQLMHKVHTLHRPTHPPYLGSWDASAISIAINLRRIATFCGKNTAIELHRNSSDAVRWAHWIYFGRKCNPEDVVMWMQRETLTSMLIAMQYELCKPNAELTSYNIRQASQLITGKFPDANEIVWLKEKYRTLSELNDYLFNIRNQS
jgi:glycosyltransferase involved in cell wall biosynthesis